jgi:putative phage-type endonuclease
VTATLSPLRTDRITASRLPALLGLSPYVTREELMREMVREHFGDEREFTGNFVTEWGKRFEPRIVAEYELTRGVVVRGSGDRQQTIVHPRLEFLAATPDGIAGDRVLECKAPWKARYTSIAERPDYQVQARLQMEVTGFRFADLAIWRQGQPLIVDSIEHDPTWLDSVMVPITTFLAEYRETVADPVLAAPHREPLKDVRTDQEWIVQAAEWLDLDFLVRQLEAERKAAAARLAELAPDKPARGGGVDLLRYERRGTVQYARLLDHLQVPAETREAFRGKATTVTTVRRIGGK